MNDPNNLFNTERLEADLKRATIIGGTVTSFAQAFRFTLRMASLIILARLLTPQDYGLIAMVIPITRFMSLLKDMGLSAATVQSANIDHAQISTLFWINASIGLIMACLTVAISPAITWFYGEQRLLLITIALAAGFVLSGFSVQHQALLRRQMHFMSLEGIAIVSMLSGLIAAVISAWNGAGYWALVIQQLVTALISTIGSWISCNWRPGLPIRHSGIDSMLTFGGNLTAVNLTRYLANNLDNVLIGLRWGTFQLGFYSKAHQILLLTTRQVSSPISRVAISVLSRIRGDNERYRRYYQNAILLVTTIGMPIVVFLFLEIDQVIHTILGSQWAASAAIFRVFAPAAFIGTFNVATGWVYISFGQTRRQFRWALIQSSITVVAFIVGANWGTVGVAAAYSIVICGIRYPAILYCFKTTPLKISDLIKIIWRPALASVTAGAGLFTATGMFNFHGSTVFGLLRDFFIYAILYVLICCLMPNNMQSFKEIIRAAYEIGVRTHKV